MTTTTTATTTPIININIVLIHITNKKYNTNIIQTMSIKQNIHQAASLLLAKILPGLGSPNSQARWKYIIWCHYICPKYMTNWPETTRWNYLTEKCPKTHQTHSIWAGQECWLQDGLAGQAYCALPSTQVAMVFFTISTGHNGFLVVMASCVWHASLCVTRTSWEVGMLWHVCETSEPGETSKPNDKSEPRKGRLQKP